MRTIDRTFSHKAINFFTNLKSPEKLPGGIEILNPYKNKEVKRISTEFYNSFFDDTNERIFILGINPGRFGGGVTGIAFTDPIALEEHCGIKNNFQKKPELSSRFVYSVINKFGGAKYFYSKFFISALYPLALINNGKNYNYYDNTLLYQHLKKDLISSLKKQASFGADKKTAVCLGRKNFTYLNEINKEMKFSEDIKTLEHPRYIMQYKLKMKEFYIQKYYEVLSNSLK